MHVKYQPNIQNNREANISEQNEKKNTFFSTKNYDWNKIPKEERKMRKQNRSWCAAPYLKIHIAINIWGLRSTE